MLVQNSEKVSKQNHTEKFLKPVYVIILLFLIRFYTKCKLNQITLVSACGQ